MAIAILEPTAGTAAPDLTTTEADLLFDLDLRVVPVGPDPDHRIDNQAVHTSYYTETSCNSCYSNCYGCSTTCHQGKHAQNMCI
jgi:hypothetical protein